jgi:hypothetical protein
MVQLANINNSSSVGICAIVNAVSAHPAIKEVEIMSVAGFGDQEMNLLVDGFLTRECILTELDVYENELTGAGLLSFANNHLHFSTLTFLNIGKNKMSDETSELLITDQHGGVHTVYDGGALLACVLQGNGYLQTLLLNFNELPPKSMELLAHALETNSTLTMLSLQGNKVPLSMDSQKVFASMMAGFNKSGLCVLDLCSTGMTIEVSLVFLLFEFYSSS